jgi:hypothetical protein
MSILIPIDPTKGTLVGATHVGEEDLTIDLGPNAFPYDYSDMTGSTLKGGPTTGNWFVLVDRSEQDYSWDNTKVYWHSYVPPQW